MTMPSISQLSPFFQMAQTGINQLGQGINQGFQTQNDVQLANALSKGDYAGAMQAAARSGNVNAVLELQKLNQQNTLQSQLGGDMGKLGAVFGGTGGSTVGPTSDASAASTTPTKVTPGYGAGYEASGMTKQDVVSYIQNAAVARGIDPSIAVKVAASEGLGAYVGDKSLGGSYGPYQLFMGGGLGNEALKAGIDPRDPSTVRQQIDFALDTAAAKGSWGDWNGAKSMGITTQGLQNAKPIGISAVNTSAQPSPVDVVNQRDRAMAARATPPAGLNLPTVPGPQAGAQRLELGPGYGLSPPPAPAAAPPLPPNAGFDQATPITPDQQTPVTPTGMPLPRDVPPGKTNVGAAGPAVGPLQPIVPPPATPAPAVPAAPIQGPPGPVTPGQAPNPNAITIGNAALSRPGFDPVVAPFARGTRAQPYSYSPSGMPGTVALGAGGVSPVPTPGAGAAYAALPPAGGAPSAAAAAPVAQGYDQAKADAFQKAAPGEIDDEDSTTGAFDLSDPDDKNALDWARKNAGQYGYKEDPNNAGTFVPVAAGGAGAGKADAIATTANAVASTPSDPNVTPAQAQTVGQSIAVHPGLSNEQKAAYLTGLAIKYSQLPGVGTMFGQMAQHFLQQSDLTNDEKEYMFSVGQGYKGSLMKWKADQQAAQRSPAGQQNIEFAQAHPEMFGLKPIPPEGIGALPPEEQKKWTDFSTQQMQKQGGVNVDVKTGETLATGYGKGLQASYDKLTSPNGSLFLINNANQMQDRLNQGIISGWGSGQPAIQNFANIAATLGFGDPTKAANTQAFVDLATQDFISQARQFFPGGRITNADLNSAKIAAGLDPAQQQQVLQDMIKVARNRALSAIDQHNENVNRFATAYPNEGGTAKTMFSIGQDKIPAYTQQAGAGQSMDNPIMLRYPSDAANLHGVWVERPDGQVKQLP